VPVGRQRGRGCRADATVAAGNDDFHSAIIQFPASAQTISAKQPILKAIFVRVG
jgi:hypothetical protein